MMRKSVIAITAVALVMALTGVSSASAAQWSPQNVNVLGTNIGSVELYTGWNHLTCSTGRLEGKTTGSSIIGNGPQVSGCNSFTGQGPYTITSSGSWSLNALSTTSASLSANTNPSGGAVLTLKYGYTNECMAVVKGPATITGLQWSNPTHQLTIPEGTTIPLQPTGPCGESLFGSSLKISGKFQYPGSLTII
jgi:hypothetical protein